MTVVIKEAIISGSSVVGHVKAINSNVNDSLKSGDKKKMQPGKSFLIS